MGGIPNSLTYCCLKGPTLSIETRKVNSFTLACTLLILREKLDSFIEKTNIATARMLLVELIEIYNNLSVEEKPFQNSLLQLK